MTLSAHLIFLMIFGRTKLRESVSRAKNCEESAGDVRFGAGPQNPAKNAENVQNFHEHKTFQRQKSNVGNHLKRVSAKFQARWSLV